MGVPGKPVYDESGKPVYCDDGKPAYFDAQGESPCCDTNFQTLVNCQSGVVVQTSSDFSAYVGQVIKFNPATDVCFFVVDGGDGSDGPRNPPGQVLTSCADCGFGCDDPSWNSDNYPTSVYCVEPSGPFLYNTGAAIPGSHNASQISRDGTSAGPWPDDGTTTKIHSTYRSGVGGGGAFAAARFAFPNVEYTTALMQSLTGSASAYGGDAYWGAGAIRLNGDGTTPEDTSGDSGLPGTPQATVIRCFLGKSVPNDLGASTAKATYELEVQNDGASGLWFKTNDLEPMAAVTGRYEHPLSFYGRSDAIHPQCPAYIDVI